MTESQSDKIGFDARSLRRRAMDRLRERPLDLSGMAAGDMEALVHELAIHQIELEVQNEELRRAQEELSAARDRYLDLYEFAPVGYLCLEPSGVIRQANLAGSRLFGVEREHLIGRRIEKFVHSEDSDACYLLLRDATASSAPAARELQLARSDGQEIWVNAEVVPERDPAGKNMGFRATLSDITVRKKAEAALIESQILLEQRVRERTAELRQRSDQLARLASEMTLSEQRERKRLAKVLHDHLQQLLVAAKFGLEVVRGCVPENPAVEQVTGILDEALKTSRSLTVELSPPILHQAGLAAGLEWLARWMKETHGLDVALRIDPKASPEREDVRVIVFEAIRELLFNVVKHAETDEVSAELAVFNEDHLRITVRDNGKGFDPDVISLYNNKGEGGFGLFSLRERLAMMGGHIEIDSAPGEGARFTIIAPMRKGIRF